jgi:CheY-like chemotaxis protein
MVLESMVVSRDWQEISVLECILNSLQISTRVVPEPERARHKLAHAKIDALILDQDMEGASNLLLDLTAERTSNSPMPVMLMGSKVRAADLEPGTDFAFLKPIAVDDAVRTLSAARNMILRGRLRYHRQALEIPIALSTKGHKAVKGKLINLSRGGAGIRLTREFTPKGPMRLRFALPGKKSTLTVESESAWSDGTGNLGVFFTSISEEQRALLDLWLAERYFTY